MRIPERFARETGREYALRTIKENIITLELEPGSPVSENELATTLGLSRTPVREALMELGGLGLVEIVPQRTSIIAPIDFSVVEEYVFARSLLECAVVEQCCTCATPADLAALGDNLRSQRFYMDDYYTDTLASLDDLFHQRLFTIAGKARTYAILSNFSVHYDRLRHLALENVKNDQIVYDHEALLAAISSKDPKTAVSLMKQHLSRYDMNQSALRQRHPPSYFR